MGFTGQSRYTPRSLAVFALAIFSFCASALGTEAETIVKSSAAERSSRLGVIRGVVRDQGGSPIADATVAIFRLGTSKLLKQVQSAADGSYIAKIIPGKYTVLAVAQGFNPVTLAEVEVNSASQLNYGFKLERAGSGNTLPEKRPDRNNPKWVIRSAAQSRSVYQNVEGEGPIKDHADAGGVEARDDRKDRSGRDSQTVVETYFGSTSNGNFAGVNAATLLPIGEKAEIVLAAQTGIGDQAPLRFETQIKFRPFDDHQIRVNTSYSKFGSTAAADNDRSLGQFSVQALDEWKVREGIIVVYGFDYSKFTGAGSDFSITPRLGFQYDIDAKTRFSTAYTTQTEERTWSREIELEDAQVIFREPVAIDDLVVVDGKPQMGKSRRLEFGVERVLDNSSSVEANVFFDATTSRGVGLASMPFDALGITGITEFVGDQTGGATGMRVVYSKRLSGRFSTAAGYSFGNGQVLSPNAISDPSQFFENDFFHSFFGQFEADLRTGTNVKTIFRLSPQATIFAIDPFKGRLAIYDPSLSVLVTQNLPTLGLPFQAEAIVDARNLFDFQIGAAGEQGGLQFNGQRRSLRGGILVRF